MSFRSLRWQIQLWHASLLVALVAIVLIVFYNYERRARVARIDAELTGPLVALFPRHIRLPGERRPPADSAPPGSPQDHARPGGGNRDVEKKLEASGHYIFILRPDGEIAYRSPNTPETVPPVETTETAMFGRWNGANRELVSRSPRGDLAILGLSETHIVADLHSFVLGLAVLGAGIIALGLLGGRFIAARAIRPLHAIGDTARRIAAGRWEERIAAGEAPAELEQLRLVLNDTFDRLAAAYEQQRRFTADASHELGTPVAIVLAQTQHALARPRSAEEYVVALAACRRVGERMRALTRDLLDLAAYDAGTAGTRQVECDLAELAREALDLVAPVAETRQSRLLDKLESVSARVDPLGLSQVLVNLLTNAVVHNAPGVAVTLTVCRAGDHAELSVEDNGRGIPPEALPHIFERFYRADPSRSRDGGGSGLGLAIARRIALLHGGDLAAENLPAGGARFTLRLPLGVGPSLPA